MTPLLLPAANIVTPPFWTEKQEPAPPVPALVPLTVTMLGALAGGTVPKVAPSVADRLRPLPLVTVTAPPALTAPPIPTPPVTTNAPVVVDVDGVDAVTVALGSNNPPVIVSPAFATNRLLTTAGVGIVVQANPFHV